MSVLSSLSTIPAARHQSGRIACYFPGYIRRNRHPDLPDLANGERISSGESVDPPEIPGEDRSRSRLAFAVAASRPFQAAVRTPTVMGDKNPKAKRKQQEQHELQKKHKAEENQRHQQRLHELHEMKHPHELKEA